jgi:hypothetical protein
MIPSPGYDPDWGQWMVIEGVFQERDYPAEDANKWM